MKKTILVTTLIFGIIASAFVTKADDATVTICHKVTLRGSTTQTTLVIPVQYLSVHLAHGDYVGACQ